MAAFRSSRPAPQPPTVATLKEVRTLPLGPFQHQEDVFMSNARNVVYVKGRRAGGTQGAAMRLIELAHHPHPPSRHLWIDTAQRNIDKVVGKRRSITIPDRGAILSERRAGLAFR